MHRPLILSTLISVSWAASLLAQEAPIDCAAPANVAAVECLNLPNESAPITNFAPLVVPFIAAGALAGLSGGSTTSTTSTTNP